MPQRSLHSGPSSNAFCAGAGAGGGFPHPKGSLGADPRQVRGRLREGMRISHGELRCGTLGAEKAEKAVVTTTTGTPRCDDDQDDGLRPESGKTIFPTRRGFQVPCSSSRESGRSQVASTCSAKGSLAVCDQQGCSSSSQSRPVSMVNTLPLTPPKGGTWDSCELRTQAVHSSL